MFAIQGAYSLLRQIILTVKMIVRLDDCELAVRNGMTAVISHSKMLIFWPSIRVVSSARALAIVQSQEAQTISHLRA